MAYKTTIFKFRVMSMENNRIERSVPTIRSINTCVCLINNYLKQGITLGSGKAVMFVTMRAVINTFLLIVLLTITAFSSPIINKSKQSGAWKGTTFKSNFKTLYRIKNAEKLQEITSLKQELHKANATSVDLRLMTKDLYILLNDTTDVDGLDNSIPYKMIFGNPIEEGVSNRNISGFLPSSDVVEIVKWIKQNKIDTEVGFMKLYDNTSAEEKEELEDRGTPKKDVLYKYYVKPLINFYLGALNEKNSIVITGE